MSWLPGTQRAEPWATMFAHQPHRVEDAGATVHEVADEDRLAALGVGVGRRRRRGTARPGDRHDLVPEPPEQRLQLVAAAVDVADDVERAVLVPSGRSRAAPARRPPPRPPRASPARRRAGSPPCGAPGATAGVARTGCGRRAGRSPGRAGPGSAPGRPARACRGRSATGRQWYCRASSTSGLRASGWTLVASMTVSRPGPAACRRRSGAPRRRPW